MGAGHRDERAPGPGGSGSATPCGPTWTCRCRGPSRRGRGAGRGGRSTRGSPARRRDGAGDGADPRGPRAVPALAARRPARHGAGARRPGRPRPPLDPCGSRRWPPWGAGRTGDLPLPAADEDGPVVLHADLEGEHLLLDGAGGLTRGPRLVRRRDGGPRARRRGARPGGGRRRGPGGGARCRDTVRNRRARCVPRPVPQCGAVGRGPPGRTGGSGTPAAAAVPPRLGLTGHEYGRCGRKDRGSRLVCGG